MFAITQVQFQSVRTNLEVSLGRKSAYSKDNGKDNWLPIVLAVFCGIGIIILCSVFQKKKNYGVCSVDALLQRCDKLCRLWQKLNLGRIHKNYDDLHIDLCCRPTFAENCHL